MTCIHAVRFYESDETIGHVVAAFLGAGFIRDEPGVIIATPERRAIVRAQLREANFSIATLERSARLFMLDAAAVLSAIVVNGTPDPVRFSSVAGALIAEVSATSHAQPRVYDEMVDVLWKTRQRDGALRLEALWDRLVASHACSVLCGHGPDRTGETGHALFGEHTHVIAENGIPHPVARM